MAEVHVQRPKIDPLQSRKFIIEIDGFPQMGFSKFSELEISHAISKYREGDQADYPTKQRGMMEFPDVTLEKGIFKEEFDLTGWDETGERRTVSIIRLDHLRQEAYRYVLNEAFPANIKLGDGDALSEDGLAIQSITLAYDWAKRV